ncbi:MAG: Dabb family protein [Jaaginema sp. PMC 1079.18]|nr:Dabb family protein [Jaaginema sp. PMC 1080.18]MEC4849601.1 Dabb family protein [Jaaginema sp. PMC 1079.18]MEC4867113.1 Dabb family protein [Jaaginema sp. PMC 1078.18]
MIEHIVLFQWQETATPEQIEAVITGLKGLKNQIPGIIDLSCGKNFCDRAQGFEYGLVVRFRDRAALEAYQPHPEHQKVVQNLIKPILAGILAVDYEII